MSGDGILVDTNLLIYILSGRKEVADYLDGKSVFVSFISEMEMLGYTGISASAVKAIKSLLHDCIVVDFNNEIKEKAISIKQKTNIKLPDAIVAATSIYLDMPLFTADKSFRKIPSIDCIIVNV